MTISGCFNSENETRVPGVSVAGNEVSYRGISSAITKGCRRVIVAADFIGQGDSGA